MRLLESNGGDEFILKEFMNDTPPYTILSHTWGRDGEEITFKDLEDGTGKGKVGYEKLQFCGKQAENDGLRYFWVDTCCIDKSSSAELTEAINSMFKWYRKSTRCYAYLADVSSEGDEGWEVAFSESRWFTRGWTLQELLAPTSVEFFSLEGRRLGDKHSLERTINDITDIPIPALRGNPLSTFSLAERMSWASKRQTTREEDRAYCLLGIFDIFIPLIYGEEKRAFDRLEKEMADAQNLKDLEEDPARELFLPSLFYPEITARMDTVQPAWENTFNWIFKDPGDSPYTAWSKFPDWLRNSTSVYWINGKAGSGKSTLMAHIFHRDETKAGLKHWSKSRQFHMLSFFFWRAGSQIQKSIPGLLRSLLYQLCDKIPQIVVPLMEECQLSAYRIPLWTERNLAACLQKAPRNASSTKFCLFIDGLDEVEGDIDQLVDVVFRLQDFENVKCCLSSRPEVRLVERLSDCSQLRLQDFNHDDIQRFVYDRTRVFPSSQTHFEDELGRRSSIAEDIVDRAEGVFLWAAFVTQTVVRGLYSGDEYEILRERVEQTPSELEAMFAQILASVDGVHKKSLAFYLQAKLWNEEFGRSLSIALLTASTQDLQDVICYREFVEKCKKTKRQIVAQSKGLLEVTALREPKEVKVWSLEQQNITRSRLYLSSSTSNNRKEVCRERRHAKNTILEQQFFKYESSSVSFFHRSAHDFFASFEAERALDFVGSVSKSDAFSKLVHGLLNIAVAAPARSGETHSSPLTLIYFHELSDYAVMCREDNEVTQYAILDEIQNLIFSLSIGEIHDLSKDEFQKFSNGNNSLLIEAKTHLRFWSDSCLYHDHFKYIQDHMEEIGMLLSRRIIYAFLIDSCIRELENHFDELFPVLHTLIVALENDYMEPPSNNSTPWLRSGTVWLDTQQNRRNISWTDNDCGSPLNHDEIVFFITNARCNWSSFKQLSKSDRKHEKSFSEVGAIIETSLKRIMSLWDPILEMFLPPSPLQHTHFSRYLQNIGHWTISRKYATQQAISLTLNLDFE